MVAKSDLPRFGPFRTGLVVTAIGLAHRARHARTAATSAAALEVASAACSASTGTQILGVFLLLAGVLLLTGASAGAILRRSGPRRAQRRTPSGCAPARVPPRLSRPPQLRPAPSSRSRPPGAVDGVEEFPDVVSPAPLLVFDSAEPSTRRSRRTTAALALRRHRTAATTTACTRCPTSRVLRRSKAVAAGTAASNGRVAETCSSRRSPTSASTRRVIGEIAGPRVTRYELQLAPGTKVSKVAGAEGRPLLRARDDRDPHPRADPRQAGGRRRGAEPLAEPRHARRHLRRPAGDLEPAVGLARQGHLRQRRLDRPRPDAAPADRRHDRLGQVRLHQHDPHARSCCARRRTRCG